MKKSAVILSVMLLTGIMGASVSFGFTQTANLDVQLNILSACNVSSPSGWLTFPDVSETTTGTLNETGVITFAVNCNVATPWTITDDKAGVVNGATTDISSTLVHQTLPANTVAYTAHYTPNAGTGIGADQTISITGEIAEADYTGKQPGTYYDLIVFTVTY